MDIQSIIERAGGSFIDLPGKTYHFAPHTEYDGAHVAAVADPDHIERLLAIPEGFRPARKPGAVAPQRSEPKPKTISAPQVVTQADSEPSAPAEDMEPAEDDEDAQSSLAPDAIDAMTRDELVATFERLEGRKPHHATKDDTLRAKLKEIAQA